MSFLARSTLLLSLLVSGHCLAAPTDPDPAFGSNGTIELPFNISEPVMQTDYVLDRMAELPLGHIALAGRKTLRLSGDTITRALLAVIQADGSAITQGDFFTSEWTPDFAPAGHDAWINALLTLPGGEALYCGGHTADGGLLNGDRAVVGRLRADLHSDLGFGEVGGQGWQRIALGLGNIDCHAIEQLSGGRILIGGSYVDQDFGQGQLNHGTFMAMLTPQGQLDTSFGNNGVVVRMIQLHADTTPRLAIRSLRQGHGHSLRPENRPIVATENNNRLGGHHARVLGILPDGSMPFSPGSSGGDMGVLPRRGLHMRRTPNGDVLLHATTSHFGATRAERRMAPHLSHQMLWTNSTSGEGGPSQYWASGVDIHQSGHTLLLMHTTESGQPNGGNHGLAIKQLDNLGQINGTMTFTGSGLDVPPGFQEILDPSDLMILRSGHYLVLFNRTLVSGSLIGPQRVYLRRFLGLNGGSPPGAGWDLDLTPASLAFPSVAAAPNDMVTSASFDISGLSPGISVPAFVTDGEISVEGGPWTAAPVELSNGHSIRLRGLAPATPGQTSHVRLYAGGLRASNSWIPRAEILVASQFAISASQPVLPGVRCSENALGSQCNGAIPDGSGNLTSTIGLLGTCNHIGKIRVGVDITHPRVGDLRISLGDPNRAVIGSNGWVTLLDQPAASGGIQGSCTGGDVFATFADNADQPVSIACELYPDTAAIAGALRPHQSLGTLIGRSGTSSPDFGEWALVVRDMASGHVGTLNDWSIELECSGTAPATADLSVALASPLWQVVAGEEASIDFVVQNNGPSSAPYTFFNASAPAQPGRALIDPYWICTASAGSSCILPPGGCTFGACPGPDAHFGLTLAAGGSATLRVFGTVDPTASGAAMLEIDASTGMHPGIGGSLDPDTSNNHTSIGIPIALEADLAAEPLDLALVAPDTLRIRAAWANHGPSLAPDFTARLSLPVGYTIQSWTCSRGGVSCGIGSLDLGGRVLDIPHQGSPGNDSLSQLEAFATFNAPAPGGVAALLVVHDDASPAIDPIPDNNTRYDLIPTEASSTIFSNGFE